jgi:hypothetical protein
MPKQIVTATMEVTKKIGRLGKRWRGEVKEDLNIMGIKNRQAMVRDHREWRKNLVKPRSTMNCSSV